MGIDKIHGEISHQTNLNKQLDTQSCQGQTNQSIKERIKSIFTDVFNEIEDYLDAQIAANQNLEVFQKLTDDLLETDQSIVDIEKSNLYTTKTRTKLTETDKTHFELTPNSKEKVVFLLNDFKDFFISSIRDKLNRQIFFVWNQKLRFNSSLKKIVKLNEQIHHLEEQLVKNPDNLKLKQQLDNKKAELKRTETFVAEYENNLAKAMKTRKQFEEIGGIHLALQTKDGETLDGTYLSAQTFQKKCVDAGARRVNMIVPVDGTNTEITGLILSKGEDANKFIETLEQLKLFKDFHEDLQASNKGGGWTKVDIGNQIAIVPDFEVERLLKKGVITENLLREEINEKGEKKVKEVSYAFNEVISNDVKLETEPLEMNPDQSGTVLMGMGAASIYEMTKREALSLLMQGVNVMLFNHRGQGESTGKPSERGAYEDVETVYQYLKQVHNVEDEKLVLRSLCLSGGILSQLASRVTSQKLMAHPI